MRSMRASSFLLVWVCAAVACGTATDVDAARPEATSPSRGPDATASIVEVLDADGRFTTLLGLYRTRNAPVPDREVSFSDILDDVDGRAWTVFAPTDAAFEALGDRAFRSLEDGPWFTSVLHRHMVPDLLRSGDLETGDLISDGGIVEVQVTGDRITYGGAEIIDSDMEAANGVIHAIDGLALPDHVRSEIGFD